MKDTLLKGDVPDSKNQTERPRFPWVHHAGAGSSFNRITALGSLRWSFSSHAPYSARRFPGIPKEVAVDDIAHPGTERHGPQ